MPEHEQRDVDVGQSVKVLAGLLATVLVALGVAAATLYLSGGPVERRADQLPDQSADFPAPRLRVDPLDEPDSYRREQADKLRHVDAAMRRLEASNWPPEQEAR